MRFGLRELSCEIEAGLMVGPRAGATFEDVVYRYGLLEISEA
jgi:hypothetical protein